MKTNFTATSATTRFSISRAQFSPLSRRSSASHSQGTLTPTMRTLAKSSPASAVARPLTSTAISPSLLAPTFWTSGELDRLQPALTRYHD